MQHFRAALRNVARAYGGFDVLAGVVGVLIKRAKTKKQGWGEL